MALEPEDELPIADAANLPRRSVIGGEVIEEHSLPDRIAMENHLDGRVNGARHSGGLTRQQIRHQRPGI